MKVKKIGISCCFVAVFTVMSHAQNVWNKTNEMLIAENPPFKQCHASTVADLGSGQLMVAWFGGTYEGSPDVVIWMSKLVNGIWSAPRPVVNGIVNDSVRFATWNPVLFSDRNGTLSLFYKVGPNPREWWGMVTRSQDKGETWSPPERLPNGILGPIKNKPIQLSNGIILSPSSTETTNAWRAHIERSIDDGKTWNVISIDPAGQYDVIQPSILSYKDGRLQVLCRSKQGYVMQAWSHDNGENWSKLTPTAIINPNAGTDAVSLQNGKQIIVYNPDVPGKDWWNGRSKLRVAESVDGEHWNDIAALENGTDEEFSYPAVIQTQDGRVHITYTYNRKNIKYVVLEESKK